MEYREDLRRCRWLSKGQIRGLAGSQDEENKLVHTAREGWPDGGDAQEANVQSKTRSDWAALAIDGTAEYSTVNPAGP